MTSSIRILPEPTRITRAKRPTGALGPLPRDAGTRSRRFARDRSPTWTLRASISSLRWTWITWRRCSTRPTKSITPKSACSWISRGVQKAGKCRIRTTVAQPVLNGFWTWSKKHLKACSIRSGIISDPVIAPEATTGSRSQPSPYPRALPNPNRSLPRVRAVPRVSRQRAFSRCWPGWRLLLWQACSHHFRNQLSSPVLPVQPRPDSVEMAVCLRCCPAAPVFLSQASARVH